MAASPSPRDVMESQALERDDAWSAIVADELPHLPPMPLRVLRRIKHAR